VNYGTKLNERHKAFIAAYMENGGNSTQAAITAGYSEKSAYAQGCALLKHAQVNAELKRLMDERYSAQVASAAEIRAFWTSVMRGEITETVVDRNGEIAEKPPAMRDRVKSAELLGKSGGMFLEKVELTGANGGPVALILNGDKIDPEKLGW
jgi:phage terminase small subunit